MPPPPPDIAERIRYKKAQYARFIDSKQWPRFNTIFVADAKITFVDANEKVVVAPNGTTPYSWQSLDAWAGFFEKALVDVQCIHLLGPGELELVRPDEVKAVFPFTYHAGPKADGQGPHETRGGHYHETWVRKGGDWFCVELWLQRLYNRVA